MRKDYWSIEIPGLTADGATRLAGRLASDSPLGVIVTDPAIFMVRGLDRWTVELIVKALRDQIKSGRLTDEETVGALSLAEDYEDWLSRAN